MSSFHEQLVSFIDELLDLFEHSNKLLYKRLIALHHHVRNELDADVVSECARRVVHEQMDAIECMNISELFGGTRYGLDVEYIWAELSIGNRITVKQWANSLVQILV